MGIDGEHNINMLQLPGTDQGYYHVVLLENPEARPAFSVEQALRDLLEVTSSMVEKRFGEGLKPGQRAGPRK